MTIEQIIFFSFGFVLTFSFCSFNYLSFTLRIALISIFLFLFIPLELNHLLLASELPFLKIKNYSAAVKYLSIGASQGIVLSLVFYVASLFSIWAISLVFEPQQRTDLLKTVDNFVAVLMTFIFFQLVDLHNLILLIQGLETFDSIRASGDIISIARLGLYGAFGFFIFYAMLHFAINLILIIINRYLKGFVNQSLASSLSFPVIILVLSLSLYPMSSEIALLIKTSFEMISK